MSELKVRRHIDEDTGIVFSFYGKSEADKVIAELKKACNDKDDWCLHTLKELRHQKFKRCLDKANYWLAVSYNCIDGKHRQKAEKHHYKWLKLAEKFRDNEAK